MPAPITARLMGIAAVSGLSGVALLRHGDSPLRLLRSAVVDSKQINLENTRPLPQEQRTRYGNEMLESPKTAEIQIDSCCYAGSPGR